MSHSAVQQSATRHYPALDGLRGVAVIAVFLCHYCESWPLSRQVPHSPTWFGWAGVDLFFVLSGFLITGILFDSLGRANYFRNFYIRRTLRIFPLYYAVWGVCLLLTPFVQVEWNRYVVSLMFYVGNLTMAGAAVGKHADPGILVIHHLPMVFGHFWTLCVEEQFYLLWPVVVLAVRDRRRLLRVALGGAVLILLSRCGLFLYRPSSAAHFYNNSFARFDTLLVGAAAALWLRGNPRPGVFSRRIYGWMFFGPLLVLAAGIVGYLHWRPSRVLETDCPVITTVGFSLLAVASLGAVLAALDEGTVVSRMLQVRPLTALGTISYGFYVLHAIPLRILVMYRLLGTNAYPAAKILTPLVAFPLVCGLSWLSFRYFETPFLRMKERLAPSVRARDVEELLQTAVPPPDSQLATFPR